MDVYKIDHVAKLTGLSKHVIRSWERRFDLLNPERGGNRYRMYTQKDVDLLSYIKKELEEGFAIGELAKLGRDNLLLQMDHKKTGKAPLKLIANPIKMEQTPPTYRMAPPLLGEHTDEILSEKIGLSKSEIINLKDKGII